MFKFREGDAMTTKKNHRNQHRDYVVIIVKNKNLVQMRKCRSIIFLILIHVQDVEVVIFHI